MAVYNPFLIARPIWAKGLCDEMNCTLGFYKKINSCGKVTLKIATSGFYRLLINGEFTYYIPDGITAELVIGDNTCSISGKGTVKID